MCFTTNLEALLKWENVHRNADIMELLYSYLLENIEEPHLSEKQNLGMMKFLSA